MGVVGPKVAPSLVSLSARSFPAIPTCEGQYAKDIEEEVVDRKSCSRMLILMEAVWLECVSRFKKDMSTDLLSMKKIGSLIRRMTTHCMASSSAAISASKEDPAGHHPAMSCQEEL